MTPKRRTAIIPGPRADYPAAQVAGLSNGELLELLAGEVSEVFWVVLPGLAGTLYVSPGYEQVFGRSCESAYSDPKSFIEAIHPDDRPRVADAMSVHGDGVPFEMEFRIIRPDGEVRWIWDRGRAVLDTSGKVLRVVGLAVDVTPHVLERERLVSAQRELRQAQFALEDRIAASRVELETTIQRLELANESAGLAVWDFNDATGALLWDERMHALHGMQLGTFDGTVAQSHRNIHPDDRQELVDGWHEAAVGGARFQANYRIVNPDGSLRYLALTARKVGAAEPGSCRWVGTCRDVTTETEALQLITTSVRENERLFEESPEPLVLIDRTGRIARMNRALTEQFGYTKEAYEGRSVHDLACLPSELVSGVRTLNSDVDAPITSRIHTSSGLRDVEVRASRIEGLSGPGWLLSFRDVTAHHRVTEMLRAGQHALRDVNRELERADRIKDDFLSSMSHELRTPLTAVLGLSESLLLGVYGELTERASSAVSSIHGAGGHLLDLINDLLDLSRAEHGHVTAALESLSARGACETALALIQPAAAARDVVVDYRVASEVDLIHADRRLLVQILVNLLSNAVKFSLPGGTVCLDVRADDAGEVVRWCVSDKGMGIAQDLHARLFSPLTQADGGLRRHFGGTGLGLALVRRFTQAHGGAVGFTSEAGAGSAFFVELPKAPRLVALDNAGPGLAPTRKQAAGLRGLVVTDLDRCLLPDWFIHAFPGSIVHCPLGELDRVFGESAPATVVFVDIRKSVQMAVDVIHSVSEAGRGATRHVIAIRDLLTGHTRDAYLSAGATTVLDRPLTRTSALELFERLP